MLTVVKVLDCLRLDIKLKSLFVWVLLCINQQINVDEIYNDFLHFNSCIQSGVGLRQTSFISAEVMSFVE